HDGAQGLKVCGCLDWHLHAVDAQRPRLLRQLDAAFGAEAPQDCHQALPLEEFGEARVGDHGHGFCPSAVGWSATKSLMERSTRAARWWPAVSRPVASLPSSAAPR